MPPIRREQLPPALLRHLLERVREREFGPRQLQVLAEWLDTGPQVPSGQWFKRLEGIIVCGESGLIKTFLLPTQHPFGEEIS